MLDVLIQVIRDLDDNPNDMNSKPFDAFVKILAFNKSINSRVEKNITKLSNLIINQHLTIEATNVDKTDIEQGSLIFKIFKQGIATNKLICDYKIDLLNI